MEAILVSACLLGERVRYNGSDKRCEHPILQRWVQEGRVVAVCPEVAGGLPTPRAPAEIEGAAGGMAVLRGIARVIDVTGRDVSVAFTQGAEAAIELIRSRHIRIAVLKENSPSCGSSFSYDGTFTGKKVPFPGVSTARLQEAGVHIFSEEQLEEAEALLKQLEAEKTR